MNVAQEPTYFLAEVGTDQQAHAAPIGGKVTLCGVPVLFPLGKGEPTCPPCVAALAQKGDES